MVQVEVRGPAGGCYGPITGKEGAGQGNPGEVKIHWRIAAPSPKVTSKAAGDAAAGS